MFGLQNTISITVVFFHMYLGKTCECPAGHFRCDGGLCVSRRTFCDGKEDCPFGEDEKDCRKCVHPYT